VNRKAQLAICLSLVLYGAGCTANQELVTQVADQGDRLVALEGHISEVNTSVAGLSLTIEQLVEVEESHSPRFGVAMAQFVMDTAGFHGIAESLAAGDPIDLSALGVVTRVHKILSSTEWPAELHEAVNNFLGRLQEFHASLEVDDAAAAAPLAETVHDEAHQLSEMIDGWMGLELQEHQDEG